MENSKANLKVKSKKNSSKGNVSDILKTEGDSLAFLIPTTTTTSGEAFKDFIKNQLLLHEKYAEEVKALSKVFNINIEVKTILKS